jgi:hypothetical protein
MLPRNSNSYTPCRSTSSRAAGCSRRGARCSKCCAIWDTRRPPSRARFRARRLRPPRSEPGRISTQSRYDDESRDRRSRQGRTRPGTCLRESFLSPTWDGPVPARVNRQLFDRGSYQERTPMKTETFPRNGSSASRKDMQRACLRRS